MIVESPDKRSIIVLSGTNPLKSCVPAISRRVLPESVRALEFVVKVVLLAFSVDEAMDNGLCRTSVVFGSERVEPPATLPPDSSVMLPPDELIFSWLLKDKAPERVRLPGPVSSGIPPRLRGVSVIFR